MSENDDEIYDAARGPRRPVTRRPVFSEWDDPTWLQVEVDEAFMRQENRQAGLPLPQRNPQRQPASLSPPEELALEWISLKQGARMLAVHPDTLLKHLKTGLLPIRHVKPGRRWMLWLEDMKKLAGDFGAVPGEFD